MDTQLNPIGLLGGTFDPIHLGHLAVATQLMHHLPLCRVELIPCANPAHRQAQASSIDRLTMAQLACQQLSAIKVNPIEYLRSGPSYTIDTVTALCAENPTQPLCLIVCSDAFNHFNQWHRWSEILEKVHLVVVTRPGYPLTQQTWAQHLLQQHQTHDFAQLRCVGGGKIFIQTIHALAISATQVRHHCLAQHSIDQLVPPAVANYIQQQALYTTRPKN